MREQFTPPEAITEKLSIEQLEPQIPENRKPLFENLSAKKALFLAALISLTGASLEAKAEDLYEKPNNLLIEELPDAGDYATACRLGHELQYFKQDREQQDPESIEAGKTGRKTIKQLTKMMLFCQHQNIDFEKTYDLSGIALNLLEQARKDFAEIQAISQNKKPKPEKPPKKLANHENLKKTSI